jgi:uncharacterized protein YjbJ (UPF0337 family)
MQTVCVRTTSKTGAIDMADTTELKGRVKEAAGDLSDDKDLQREGKADQTAGKTKEKFDHAVDKVKDALTKDRNS